MRRQRWWPRLLAALLLVLALAGASTVYRGPWLRAHTVVVLGNERVPTAAVLERAALEGRSLLTLDEQAAARRVEALPWVRRAQVQRWWPSTLAVRVEERQPVAVWVKGGETYLVDEEGRVLDRGVGPGLTVILDRDPGSVAPGDRVDATALAIARRLQERLPQVMGTSVTGFEYTQQGGLLVITPKGRARWGTVADLEYQLAVWKAVLAQAAQLSVPVQHVDLRFGYRPFLR
jgi:cell division septal protein FtsQ